jgi:hypothetical protein
VETNEYGSGREGDVANNMKNGEREGSKRERDSEHGPITSMANGEKS